MSLYSKRGVSAQKEDVHQATASLDTGLFPHSFCKVYRDFIGEDEEWVNVMHADGAGTKSILAYLYWKETGDISVWRGIAQDAIVMNLDDLICVGITNSFLFSSTIDRNKNKIPGEILKEIIEGSKEFFEKMSESGIDIHFMGGETADVGDVVRTIAVNGTMMARWPRKKIITNEKIKAGDMIIGLSSFGKSNYEREYNSGIASNGLTSARHDVLNKDYKDFSESYDPSLEDAVVYIGKSKLSDKIAIDDDQLTVGKLLLSPTRTFAPVIRTMLQEKFEAIHGLIHCSGGGQTKCLKYMKDDVRIVKDNLFHAPPVFELIKQSSGASNSEMYQVFNMGTRLEIYTSTNDTGDLIEIAHSFGIEAKVIGRVEAASGKSMLIKLGEEELRY